MAFMRISFSVIMLLSAFLSLQAQKANPENVDSLARVVVNLPDDTNKVNWYNDIARAYTEYQPDLAIENASKGLSLAERLKFGRGYAYGLYIQAYASMIKDDQQKALQLFQQSLEHPSATRTIKIDCHRGKGRVYENKSDYSLALNEYLEAQKLIDQLGDRKQIAENYSNIGTINDMMGHKEEAVRYLQDALKIHEETNNQLGIAQTCNNLGITLDFMSRNEEAMNYFNRALKIAHEMKNPLGIAFVSGSIANHYHVLGDHRKALNYSYEVLDMFEMLNDPYNMAAIHINMGELFTELGRYDSAEVSLKSGLDIALQIGAKQWITNAYSGLYDVYNKQNKHKDALENFIQYVTYRDSISNEENTRQATKLQMQYEFDKKEAEAKAEQEKKDAEASQKLKREELVRNVFIGGFVIVLVFAVIFFAQRNTISKGKKLSDELLLNILPEEVAEELKTKGEAEAHLMEEVTVLFTDFKGFTALSEKLSPKELVADIHECFSAFDRIMEKHRVEKIKTIGDAYMAAGGLPTPNNTHASDVVKAALEIRDFMEEGKRKKIALGLPYFEIRIGIHTGPVVAGIVGVKKFAYDIWGDTVNTASRMESSGEAGKVNISGSTWQLVHHEFRTEFRGRIAAKGKGEMDMYFVEYNQNNQTL